MAACGYLDRPWPGELPDGLHVGICGAGSPFPDDRRAGPCTTVVAGKRLFVFDAGSGSPRNIGKLGFVHRRIEAIFLTHFHSDHVDGLGELMLQRWEKPFLTLFSNRDPVTRGGYKPWQKLVPGAHGQPHAVVRDAGHFLQEDKGAEVATAVAAFIQATPVP